MIEKLDSNLVDEWKRHPVTRALVEDLRGERERMRERLENLSGSDLEHIPAFLATGARAAQLRDVIDRITHAKGKPGE